MHSKQDTHSITPIIVALLPSFLSTLTGISWVEYILLALVTWYLYVILKVPGDLLLQLRAIEQKIPKNIYRKRENMVMAAYSLSPVIAGLGLYWIQLLLPNLILLSHFSVSIFFFTAFLKPFMFLSGILAENVRNKLLTDLVNLDTLDTQNNLKFQELSQMILDLDQKLNKLEQIFTDSQPLLQKQINQVKREVKLRTRVDEAEKISLLEARVLNNEENMEIVFHHLLQREKSITHVVNGERKLGTVVGVYENFVLWILGFPKNLFVQVFGRDKEEDNLWSDSNAIR